ncbi:MAG: hypothetical protein ACO3TP_11490, partial [Ilumatobacteraceae bacterium]
MSAHSGWDLNNSLSRLSFVSIKATDIGEVHSFTQLAGKLTDDEDDVPEFEQVGGVSPSKQKDSIDHAMELASTVVENFGLNDVVSPLRRSVSQLVNTGQF